MEKIISMKVRQKNSAGQNTPDPVRQMALLNTVLRAAERGGNDTMAVYGRRLKECITLFDAGEYSQAQDAFQKLLHDRARLLATPSLAQYPSIARSLKDSIIYPADEHPLSVLGACAAAARAATAPDMDAKARLESFERAKTYNHFAMQVEEQSFDADKEAFFAIYKSKAKPDAAPQGELDQSSALHTTRAAWARAEKFASDRWASTLEQQIKLREISTHLVNSVRAFETAQQADKNAKITVEEPGPFLQEVKPKNMLGKLALALGIKKQEFARPLIRKEKPLKAVKMLEAKAEWTLYLQAKVGLDSVDTDSRAWQFLQDLTGKVEDQTPALALNKIAELRETAGKESMTAAAFDTAQKKILGLDLDESIARRSEALAAGRIFGASGAAETITVSEMPAGKEGTLYAPAAPDPSRDAPEDSRPPAASPAQMRARYSSLAALAKDKDASGALEPLAKFARDVSVVFRMMGQAENPSMPQAKRDALMTGAEKIFENLRRRQTALLQCYEGKELSENLLRLLVRGEDTKSGMEATYALFKNARKKPHPPKESVAAQTPQHAYEPLSVAAPGARLSREGWEDKSMPQRRFIEQDNPDIDWTKYTLDKAGTTLSQKGWQDPSLPRQTRARVDIEAAARKFSLAGWGTFPKPDGWEYESRPGLNKKVPLTSGRRRHLTLAPLDEPLDLKGWEDPSAPRVQRSITPSPEIDAQKFTLADRDAYRVQKAFVDTTSPYARRSQTMPGAGGEKMSDLKAMRWALKVVQSLKSAPPFNDPEIDAVREFAQNYHRFLARGEGFDALVQSSKAMSEALSTENGTEFAALDSLIIAHGQDAMKATRLLNRAITDKAMTQERFAQISTFARAYRDERDKQVMDALVKGKPIEGERAFTNRSASSLAVLDDHNAEPGASYCKLPDDFYTAVKDNAAQAGSPSSARQQRKTRTAAAYGDMNPS